MKRLPCGDVAQGHEVSLTQKSTGLEKPCYCDQKHWMELWPFKSQPRPLGTQVIWSCWQLPRCLWYSRSWGWGQTTRARMVTVHITASRPATVSPVCLLLVGHQAVLLSCLLISLLLTQRVPQVPQSPLKRGEKKIILSQPWGWGRKQGDYTFVGLSLTTVHV